jgi:GDP-4-dehydro-6-deoxy-D-mannose reductase
MSNVAHVCDKINWVELDVEDMRSCIDALRESQPDVIHHLAAQSFVPTSWRAPQQTFTTNVIGTINLLEAVRVEDIDPLFHYAGSSEEYGLVKEDELPINENNPLRPLSPYGVSKAAGDLLCQQYHRSYGIKTVITRAFNHSGARRGEVFVTSNFAKQIAEIERGLRKPVIYVGNLEAKRDFTDVRDICRAYMLLEKCKWGEVYNVCSGRAWSIKSVLDYLILFSSVRDIKVEQDPSRMRPSDVPVLLGSYSKFKGETGWEPRIPFEKTLEDLLNYWRAKLCASA